MQSAFAFVMAPYQIAILITKPEPIMVKKGEYFDVIVVAVDHVNHPVNATIIRGSLSGKSIIGEGREVQNTTEGCTKLTYNISSPDDSVNLGLYARKGPCKDWTLKGSSEG